MEDETTLDSDGGLFGTIGRLLAFLAISIVVGIGGTIGVLFVLSLAGLIPGS